jgi:hypothetical protein
MARSSPKAEVTSSNLVGRASVMRSSPETGRVVGGASQSETSLRRHHRKDMELML